MKKVGYFIISKLWLSRDKLDKIIYFLRYLGGMVCYDWILI